MATTEHILNGLKTYGRTVLAGPDATRGRALEIRKLAKAEGLVVRFHKAGTRVIELEVSK